MKKKTLVSKPLKDFSSFNRKVGKGNEKFLKMLIEEVRRKDVRSDYYNYGGKKIQKKF
nr:MAG TPA: hypothetical protein [Caudoviricetes sp.]